jgi:hypothetical protein
MEGDGGPPPIGEGAGNDEGIDDMAEDGDEVAGALGDRMALLDREDNDFLAMWGADLDEFSDSDVSVGIDEPPAALAPPGSMPGSSSGPAVLAAGGGGRGPDASPWPAVEATAWGRFVLDKSNDSVGCHCPLHGGRINKVMRKRPIWYFCGWLLAGYDPSIPEGEAGRNDHMAVRRETKAGGRVDYDNRLFARGQAVLDDSLDVLFEWERTYASAAGIVQANDVEPASVG